MWAAVVAALLGIGQMAYGAYQKKKASKMTGTQPAYPISDMYGANVGLAEQQAQTGFSPATLNNITQTLQQNFAGGTNAILQSGGSTNDIAKLYGINAQQMKALGVEDEKLRIPKIANLMDARLNYAGQKLAQWKFDSLDRFKDKQAAAAALGAAGNQAINSGLNTAIQGIGSGINLYSTRQAPNGASQNQNTNLFSNGAKYSNKNNMDAIWNDGGADTYNVDQVGNPAIPTSPLFQDFNNFNSAFV